MKAANNNQTASRNTKIRLALLTWAAAWPVITGLLELLNPLVAKWPLPLRTLLLSGLMVGLLSFAILPRLQATFRSWLNPITHNS